jgi:hypothetical protein
MELNAQKVRLRAERRLGELMKLQKETIGLNTGARGIGKSVRPGADAHSKPTLKEAGISNRLADKARKLARARPKWASAAMPYLCNQG